MHKMSFGQIFDLNVYFTYIMVCKLLKSILVGFRMLPIVSLSGHNYRLRDAVRRDRSLTRNINDQLVEARGFMTPFNLDGVALELTLAHINTKVFRAGLKTREHRHDELQLEYVLDGQIEFRHRSDVHVLNPGMGLWIAPGVVHSWICREQGLMLGVHLTLTGRKSAEFAEWIRMKSGWRLIPLEREKEADTELASFFNAILPSEPSSPWQRERSGCLLFLWLAKTLSFGLDLSEWRGPTPPGGRGDRSRVLVERAMAFMKSNLASPIRLEDIALHLGISTRQLGRVFRDYFRETVNNALTRLRLERAREMTLSEPDRPLKDIAFECGFSRQAYFTACFRRRFGAPPNQFRRSRARRSQNEGANHSHGY